MKARKNGKVVKSSEVSPAEAAALIGCSGETVRALLVRGDLKGWRLSERGWWNVERASVRDFLKRRGAPNWRSV